VNFYFSVDTGTMTLKKRLGMLKGIYDPQMPYRDPHTAGPALWALYQLHSQPFRVSVVPIEGLTPWRKGLECVAISLYRHEHQCSPTVNFGRMPPGYRMSSGNNARLTSTGGLFRGGPISEQEKSHFPGIAPVGPLEGDPYSPNWCGHAWSEWVAIKEALRIIPPEATGLYRIRKPDQAGLLYIGQGKVRKRLSDHRNKVDQPAHPQSTIFTKSMECSWVLDASWLSHQLLELENDLIAAYILHTGTIPPAQFIGERPSRSDEVEKPGLKKQAKTQQ
jgi:hypothetical protein